jgi:hypothetical protein
VSRWRRDCSAVVVDEAALAPAVGLNTGTARLGVRSNGVYGAADRTLVLIRPDGYLALISDAGDVSAVADYIAAIS